MGTCIIENCNRKTVAKGYCDKHYRRFKRSGDPYTDSRFKNRKCSIDGCNEKHYGKGFCKYHYMKDYYNGDPLFDNSNKDKKCLIESCNRGAYSKGFCPKHYSRFRKHGDPLYVNDKLHGLSKTPEFQVWCSMRERCTKDIPDHYRYFGRGIKVCDRWMKSFEFFYEDMGPRPTLKHQIDRIDNDGNYEPSNCRWVTRTENIRNSSATKLTGSDVLEIRELFILGISRKEIADKFGVCTATITNVTQKHNWRDI